MSNIFERGDIVKWVNNSSWHAHQNKIVFRLDSIFKNNKLCSVIYKQDFDEYSLHGILLYKQIDGKWIIAEYSENIKVKWLYNNNVGGGFPSLITSFQRF